MPALEPRIGMKDENGIDGCIIKQVLYANIATSMKYKKVVNVFLREPLFKKIDGFFSDFNANHQASWVLFSVIYNKNFLPETNFKIDTGKCMNVDIFAEFFETLTAT